MEPGGVSPGSGGGTDPQLQRDGSGEGSGLRGGRGGSRGGDRALARSHNAGRRALTPPGYTLPPGAGPVGVDSVYLGGRQPMSS